MSHRGHTRAEDRLPRDHVERGFADTTQSRGQAARYDKHARIYPGADFLRAIILWLKPLGDTP